MVNEWNLGSEKTYPCIELPFYCYLNTGIHNDHDLHHVFYLTEKCVLLLSPECFMFCIFVCLFVFSVCSSNHTFCVPFIYALKLGYYVPFP